MRLIEIIIATFIMLSISNQGFAKTYSSLEGEYTIEFPEKWEVLEGIMGTDVMALAPVEDEADLFRENGNIIFTNFQFPISKKEYYSYNISSLQELLTDFNLEEVEDVNLSGVEAKKIVFSHTVGVVNAQVIQYLILEDSYAFVLSFTADPIDYPKMKEQFEEIAQSFVFR